MVASELLPVLSAQMFDDLAVGRRLIGKTNPQFE